MEDRRKAQITVGLLAFFASMWILIEQTKQYNILFDSVLFIIVVFIALLVLSYVIITILEWISIFDLKTN